MSPDSKLISGLVNRIVLKLPSKSGKSIDSVKNDPLIQQTVTALIDLSKFRLPIVVSTLVTAVENESNVTVSDDFIPYDILQSQAFLLDILRNCMNHHWTITAEAARESSSSSKDGLSRATSSSVVREESVYSSESSTSRQSVELSRLTVLPDPPPLDDALVKNLISTLARIIGQVFIYEERDKSQQRPRTRTDYFTISRTFSPIAGNVYDIAYQAGREIIYYVSASNWPIVFGKVKTWFLFLAASKEECPDTTEVRLLECSALNSKRLSAVFDALQSAFLHLRKPTQLAVAAILRKAIWNWIETYPSEFLAMYQSGKRFEGNPELLFEACIHLADTPKRKAIIWPLQTVLLILCPDVILSFTDDNRPTHSKKQSAFMINLRKAWKEGRTMTAIAALCFTDLCRAASYLPKSNNLALRLIIPDIEHELKTQLFQIDWPIIDETILSLSHLTVDHRYVIADCLVMIFKLNYRHALQEIFPACLSDRNLPVFRQCLVKACLAIASEKTLLPWSPPVAHIYSKMSDPLKRLFMEAASKEGSPRSDTSSQTGSSSARKALMSATSDRKVKKEVRPETGNERSNLMLDLLQLYDADPIVALSGNNEIKVEQNAALFISITNCLRDSAPCVRDSASDLITKLHSPEYIIAWGPPDQTMEAFWKISSQVLFSLAKQLLDSKQHDDSLKKLLGILGRLLEHRNSFLRKNKLVASVGSDVRERLQASIGLEVALLILLCSPDIDTCSAAIECLGHICVELNLTTQATDAPQTSLMIIDNLPIYAELTSPTGIVTGRKSQQKRIRRLLRLMPHCTHGNIAAWEEARKRWKYLTTSVTRTVEETREDMSETSKKSSQTWHDKLRHKEGRQFNTISAGSSISTVSVTATPSTRRIETMDDEKSTEWQNYAGFLAALGGICLMTNPAHHQGSSSERTSSSNPGATATTPTAAPSESARMVDEFVMVMVDLLLCQKIIVREWVKEILGSEMSPALYPILFRHLENVLAKCFSADGDPICNSKYTLFVEQAIGVLKAVLDRLEDPAENLFTVDFGALISQYGRYINKLESNQAALKMKIKFCQLCEVLMQKKDRVTLRQEFILRNKLLEIIVEWISNFSLSEPTASPTTSFEVSLTEKIQQDLDLVCLKTVVVLLHQLPLHPTDSSRDTRDTDTTSVKSKIFYRYFSFFLKLLNMCKPAEDDGNAGYLASMRECTILAMSNLLSANVDAGLKYSLSMGYHDESRIRTAFMQVLSNILNQGTEFDTLSETVMTDRYQKIIELLVTSDVNIALSLCDNCLGADMDDIATVLLTCFASRNQTSVLLRAVIEKEVRSTESHSELFRRTSIATRLLSVFARMNGSSYVRSVLLPVFDKLASLPPEESKFELDSSKLGPDEDVARHKQNVVNATELFLNAICNSAKQAPRCFREACHCILSTVRETFPESKYTAVGAFIFLRFFCPAIVSPESEGLVQLMKKPITPDMRRGNLIATKVIQNLANNVLFGAKETYMIVLNDFLTSNIYKVTSFLRDISNISDLEGEPAEARAMEDRDFALMHRVLVQNVERISRGAPSPMAHLYKDSESATEWKHKVDKLINMIAQLGQAPDVPRKGQILSTNTLSAAANQHYFEFMRRNNHKNVEPITSKNIFYQGGTSKSGLPTYYFIARNVVANSIDFELLVYHVFQALESSGGKSFEIVVDATMFGPTNEIPNQCVSQFVQLFPVELHDKVAAVHIYNPNSDLRHYMKRLPYPISARLARRITFSVTPSELHEVIHPSEIRLPKLTLTLDSEPSTIFYPVSRLSPHRGSTSIPVTVKVGAEYIQIMTVRKQEMFAGATAVTNDIFGIAEIEDVSVGRHALGPEPAHEFSFKYNKGTAQLVLSTPKRVAIVSMIQHSKRGLDHNKSTNLSERAIRPSDVPGRLLNMALLNLGSQDSSLRQAAYNLLCSISMTFKFGVEKQILETKNLCIPANSKSFVVSVSEQIAQSEPELTLEFLSECIVGFSKSSDAQRYLCLDYMVPWLPNLAKFCSLTSDEDDAKMIKAKDVIRLLIELTVARTNIYKLVQSKIWKTIGKIDDLSNLVLEVFIQVSKEHGIGSPQAEAMADTFVTLSNVTLRGKVITRMRKVLQKTSQKPTGSLMEHPAWPEIAVLLRFILMLSFNNRGPVKNYVPEIFYIVSLVVGVGSTIIKASVHGLIVNMIQALCTSVPLPEANIKKLQLLLNELSDPKFRHNFGLSKSHTNAFTITPDTVSDVSEPLELASLETIIVSLLDVLHSGAPSPDISNAWQARWMSLVTSTAFQFNPAVQPRAFVVMGCLAGDEVDDDILYQILVALRSALTIFDESDPSLVLSIMMCLKNIMRSVQSDSQYLVPLAWVAIALIEINNGPTFAVALELLLAILRTLDGHGYFKNASVEHVLLSAREPMAQVGRQLDEQCGVRLESHFSLGLMALFMKGVRHHDAKGAIYQSLTTLMEIERKYRPSDTIDISTLGYILGLVPMSVKTSSLDDIARLADLLVSSDDPSKSPDMIAKQICVDLFSKIAPLDNSSAILLLSMLTAQLFVYDNETERLLIYTLLSEASTAYRAVFSVVYDKLVPELNKVLSGHSSPMIDAARSIVLCACREGPDDAQYAQQQASLLQDLGFPCLGEPAFGGQSMDELQKAQLASDVIQKIIT